MENFDAEVHEKLRVNLKESETYLDTYNRWLWYATKYYLDGNADFAEHEYSFMLKNNPFPNERIDKGPYRIGKNVDDAHIYRPGHPLAQRILNEIKNKSLTDAEIVFDYSGHREIISVLQDLVGKAGALKVSNYKVKSFEEEDSVIISAFDESGERIDPEVAKKLFSVSADGVKPITIAPEQKSKLDELEQKTINEISSRIAKRNNEFFDNEVDKLDKWAEDVKKAIELDLKKLDIEIKTAKTNAKKIVNLEEKVKAQRDIKDMEKKRNEMRMKLYEAQDEVDLRKERLIDQVEAQLKQESTLEPLFTIQWSVV